MGRPSKYGEVTELIRVPVSKLETVRSVIDGSFVQNSQSGDEAVINNIIDATLAECETLDIDPRQLLLKLEFNQICQTLDKFRHPEQLQFCTMLIQRYMSDDQPVLEPPKTLPFQRGDLVLFEGEIWEFRAHNMDGHVTINRKAQSNLTSKRVPHDNFYKSARTP